MRLLATFGLILICYQAWAIETDGYPPRKETFIDVPGFLEKMKDKIKNGDSSLGLPPLDPYTSNEQPLNLDTDILKLDATLTNVNVQGLSAYKVNGGDFRLAGMTFMMNLTWPLVHATTNYKMKGIIGGEMSIFGKGDMTINAQNFDLYVELSFKMNDGHLAVKSIESKFALETLEFNATGLLDDEELSELLSSVISDMMPQMVEEYQADIQDYVHPVIINALDTFLSDKSLSDIIKILG